MTALLLDLPLALGLFGAGAATLLARSLFGAVLGFISTGLIATLVWVRLEAPDVALTEAVIGAAATSVIILYVASRIGNRATPPAPPPIAQRVLAGILSALLAVLLAHALFSLPEPAPSLAAPVLDNIAPTGLGNPVTAVLMAHRAIDTLLESAVLVFAVFAIWSMAPERRWGRAPGPAFMAEAHGPLAFLAKVLPPIGIVIGVYIAWVGADAPGGKFQGGAVLAAMWVLPWIAGLVAPPSISDIRLRLAIAAGPFVFLMVGLMGFAVAEGFLAYPPGYAKTLILLIETAMTLSVAAAMACMIAGPPERRARP
ncbi:MAG: hydrogenase subunit MbhD domain-containing protein [Acetobacteraceae bacterium]|jgi:multisubunit Na+/H+ antiporter MnhB subunit